MKKQGTIKVAGGKLIKVQLEENQGMIKTIKITGDFFLYPEEKIKDLELLLKGCKIEELYEKTKHFFQTVELVGATADDFYKVIKKAFENKSLSSLSQ